MTIVKNFTYKKKKIYENNNSVPIQSSKLRSILIKISNFLPIIKKFYNYFRKTKNYKLLKLNKNNPNILIINVKKILS